MFGFSDETYIDVQSGDGDRSLNPDLVLDGIVATMFESSVNDQKDVLELLKEKATVLGIVKKAAVVNKAIIEGKPVVIANKGKEVAKAYFEIALNI